MDRLTSQGKRWYVASMETWSFVFESYWLPGSFGIYADALSVARDAGIQAGFDNWDGLRIDGPYAFRWRARMAMKKLGTLPNETE